MAKSASAATRYTYRGPKIHSGVVVRLDLNEYSKWARGRNVAERASYLDAFFSIVVPHLEQAGGVYFRDEGDCIVCLFSDYFQSRWSIDGVINFCRTVVRNSFGQEALTSKASIGVGDIAFFQKSHEKADGDWSAEGEPFVTAARLEQAVVSKQRVNYFTDEHQRYFRGRGSTAKPGEIYHWETLEESIQVPGLGLSGGWASVTFDRHLSEPRRA